MKYSLRCVVFMNFLLLILVVVLLEPDEVVTIEGNQRNMEQSEWYPIACTEATRTAATERRR